MQIRLSTKSTVYTLNNAIQQTYMNTITFDIVHN